MTDGGSPLAVVGGPLGRRATAAARSWPATVLPLMVLSAGMMALSVLQRGHCVAQGWKDSDQFWHACFSDLPSAYTLGNLQAGLPAYLGSTSELTRVDQPVVTGAVMAFLGGLVPDGSALAQSRWYFALWALLATALVAAMVWLVAASRPRRAADAALVALSPVLLLAPLVGPDVVGVALATAAIWAWARRHHALAGVLLGLAIGARTYPVLVLVALGLLAFRTGSYHAVRRVALTALGTLAVFLLPFLLGNAEAIPRFYHAWRAQVVGFGSPWILPQLAGHPLPSGAVTALAVAGWLMALLAAAAFALGARRRPTLPEVSLVLVGIVLVTGVSFPVQASLWLLPLVALCGVRWRDALVWAMAEGLHFVAVWLYLGGQSTPDRGMPPEWYAVFLLARVAAVGYLVWRVWRTAADRPEYEPTDEDPLAPGQGPDPWSDEVLDETAGDFTGRPDQLVVRFT